MNKKSLDKLILIVKILLTILVNMFLLGLFVTGFITSAFSNDSFISLFRLIFYVLLMICFNYVIWKKVNMNYNACAKIMKPALYTLFLLILGIIGIIVCISIMIIVLIMLAPLMYLVGSSPDFENVLYLILSIIMVPACWIFVFKNISETKKAVLGSVFLLWIAMTMGSLTVKHAIDIDTCSDSGRCSGEKIYNIDSCLDKGYCWNYEQKRCEKFQEKCSPRPISR
ncbi:hypothetical protein J6E39_00340 [bacterium]|nr:hypothetical protein [bacterium]